MASAAGAPSLSGPNARAARARAAHRARSVAAAGTLALSLVWLAAASPTARAAIAPGSVNMVSESGDYIGRGTDRLFDAPGAVSMTGGADFVQVTATATGTSEEFQLEFAPPAGRRLEVGEYTGAERFPFEAEGSPGLTVSGPGSECNEDFGRFVIKDIRFDRSGKVTRLWALYEEHCERPEAPALFGEVRIGEPLAHRPERVEPAAIEWPRTAVGAKGEGVLVTVVGGESGAAIGAVSLRGKNPHDFAIPSNGCAGAVLSPGARCKVKVVAKPTAPGLRTAALVVADTSGAKTSVRLAVDAEPLLKLDSATLVSEPGDFIGGGTDRLFDNPHAVSLRGEPAHVELTAEHNGDSFTFDFAAPSGKQLEVGDYPGAERYPFQAEGSPGLSVSGDGSGCNQDFGRFTVKDIHFDASGRPDRFWALYEQHCERPEAPALFGEVRVGEPATEAPEAVEPAAVAWPHTAVGASAVSVPVTVIGGESGAHLVAVGLEGEDAGDFTIPSDGCDGANLTPGHRCELTVAVKPTAAGPRAAQLVVADNSGARTVVPLSLDAGP
jgi:hypothetical protein